MDEIFTEEKVERKTELDLVRQSFTEEHDDLMKKMKTALKDVPEIREIKLVGSMESKTALVNKSDMDIWIILEDAGFVMDTLNKDDRI
jgi:tRNA nucleotidyltransferase (CCA-adding enzyme)